jgi:hypothetical protein
MNAEYGDMTRTSPEARRVNTCGATASAIPPLLLTGRELLSNDLASPDRDDQTA